MAKAKPKKSKGALGRAASLLGSIPAVGNVRNAAKKVGKATKTIKKSVKKATKTVKKVAKSAKKKVKKTVKKKKKKASKLKKVLKKAKKKVKRKVKKKLKKKVGKVFTKARKLKNNLSKNKRVQKLKKKMKKTVLKAKKGIKKVKKAVKKASKTIKKTVTVTKGIGKAMVLASKNKGALKESTKSVVKTFFAPLASLVSLAADFTPIISNVKAGYEASRGVDPITGKKLDAIDRSLAAGSIILGPFGKVVSRGRQGAKLADEAIDTAEEIISALKKSDTPPKKDKTPVKDTGNAINQVTKRSDPATYYTYDELRALTKGSGLTGRNVGLESHHLLSKQFASKFDVSQGDIISVPLTPMNHRGSGGEKIIGSGMNINNAIQKELKNIVGTNTERAAVKNATPEQIWQSHRNVYEKMGNSDWAKAIYDAHVKPLGIPYK